MELSTDSTKGEEPRHFARLQYSYAIGEQGVVIMQVVPEIGVGFTERFSLQLKVPFLSASGNLGEYIASAMSSSLQAMRSSKSKIGT